ncbi:hypothetical protein BASA81_010133 [Batrachochytrium salamandrivorans]|nr:hypothetical protein BASA81_010133 [Batrachochytrium salamandrivorans]
MRRGARFGPPAPSPTSAVRRGMKPNTAPPLVLDGKLCILVIALLLSLALFFHIYTSDVRLEAPGFLFRPKVVSTSTHLAASVEDSFQGFAVLEIVREPSKPATDSPTTTSSPTTTIVTLSPTTALTTKENGEEDTYEEVKDENAESSTATTAMEVSVADGEASGQVLNVKVQLPDYTAEELTKRGFGKVLYVYRVVADNVAVRTKPSPIGSLMGQTSETIGPIHGGGYKRGDLVVGLQLANVFGLWLKLGPYYWAPISKKKGDVFLPVMKQLKMIPIPKYLRHYWAKPKCADEETSAECRDSNMVRAGVLQVLRRMKLMEESMDPDFAAPTSFPTSSLLPKAEEEQSIPLIDDPSTVNEEEPSLVEQQMTVEQTVEEPISNLNASVTDEMHTHCQTFLSKDTCPMETNCTWFRQRCGLECRQANSWFACTKRSACAWIHNPNQEYCDLDLQPDTKNIPQNMAHDTAFDFHPQPGEKFFIYQPSGGWNNQRLLMENAMVVCLLLNRTCIAPPASPHSNFFRNYNNIPSSGVVAMSRVINFQQLNQVVPVQTIPQGYSFPSFLQHQVFGKLSVRTIIKDISKYKPGTMTKWAERDIIRLFGNVSADVLYFSNQTMWGTMEWRGTVAGRYERKQVQAAMMPANHIKQLARELAERLGPYHAVHIRRGDKVGESNFLQVSHPPQWWAERIAQYTSETNIVYIATDEAKRIYFDTFIRDFGLQPVFFESLPEYNTLVKPYLAYFPQRMSMDILGMVEQSGTKRVRAIHWLV